MKTFNLLLENKEKLRVEKQCVVQNILTASKLEYKFEVYFLYEKKHMIENTLDMIEDILIELQKEHPEIKS